MREFSKKKVLGVGITDASEEETLEYILQGLKKKEENYYIVTPNPEILVFANSHPMFRTILNNARLALCDGAGLMWAGKFEAKSFRERVTGTDLVENLCKEVSKRPITVGFLGARGRIAEVTAECLISKYPGLKVVFAASEWENKGFVRAEKYYVSSIKYHARDERAKIQNTPIDILFVAFGFPKQEEWMAQNVSSHKFRVAIGVGGAFDYISERVPRAPFFVRHLGFEWLFRLIVQPWRLKRQLALLKFALLVLQEKISDSMSA